eukprot:gnl/Trimastix_PCT/1867.p1 GENE.gnl/Trimastix_PCT/1867~~gnl/Trimastix_PCT/1867.p1  ORF type:complete len:412 (+),score=65.80 gnl/Trimastix_PCT/1867:48-1283(+)
MGQYKRQSSPGRDPTVASPGTEDLSEGPRGTIHTNDLKSCHASSELSHRFYFTYLTKMNTTTSLDATPRPALLICGGAGYIGSHVVRHVLESNRFDVVVVDNMNKGHAPALPSNVPLERGDVRDKAFLSSVFTKYPAIQAVMHFCADIEAGESMVDPMRFYNNNMYGAICLVETMLKHDVKKLIFSSTAAIFGQPDEVPIPEDAKKDPTNCYGQTKLSIEQMLHWCGVAHNFQAVCLRYFNAAGAHISGEIGEAHHPETHLIPLVLQVPLQQRSKIYIFGTDYPTPDGTCVRDYIHVSDLAQAHLLAVSHLLKRSAEEARASPILQFNLGTGRGYSVKEVIETARRVTGHAIPAEERPRRAGDPAELVAFSAKAQEVLGWEPRMSDLETILSTSWRWHQAHPNGYADSDSE